MPDLALFRGLTGRAGNPTGSIKEMLIAAYGSNKPGRPDTRKAAQDLGVSQRTVQRWIAGEDRKQRNKPKADSLSKVRIRARQAATTKKGRKAAVQKARENLSNRKAVQLSIYAMQGPKTGGKDYSRLRSTSIQVSGDEVEAMFDAYERGGDKAVTQWLETQYSGSYVPDWGLADIRDMKLQ